MEDVTMGDLGRCETCLHWKAVEPDHAFDKLVMGRCVAIRQREDIIEPAQKIDDWAAREAEEERLMLLEKAIAVDGSGYYAAVRTQGSFGCILHDQSLQEQPNDGGRDDG